ncbi:MAG: hypothetical protein IKB93_01435 [Clostridia bacterium]|nr:hypothetical protein [Clostridia bacterium]
MYSNIGKKIQKLAMVCAILGMIGSVSIGGSLISSADNSILGTNEFLIVIGIIVIVLGSILSWVLSFVLYGFGRLVENSDIIARQYRRKNGNESYPEEQSQPMSQTIRNVMDKSAIAAKAIYDKSGEFIGNQAQKAQARRESAAQQPQQYSQRPIQRPVQPQANYDDYSNSKPEPKTQQPAENSFASNYEFLDL